MNKKITIILLSLILISTISLVSATEYKTINLRGHTIDIPKQYENGTILNKSTDNIMYRNYTDDNGIFSVTIYNEYSSSLVKFLGFWIDHMDSTEEMTIEGRPILLMSEDNQYQGRITYIAFESNGSIIFIQLPHSKGLTEIGRHMVKSTADPLLTSEELYTLLNKSATDYRAYAERQNQNDYYYDDAFYDGYDYGYSDGQPSGYLSGMFNYYGL